MYCSRKMILCTMELTEYKLSQLNGILIRYRSKNDR